MPRRIDFTTAIAWQPRPHLLNEVNEVLVRDLAPSLVGDVEHCSEGQGEGRESDQ